jgi:sugar phosphate isomerase/epimerase
MGDNDMIGIIGATGTTGRGLIATLKEKGAEFRCLVRDTAKAAETLGSDVELVTRFREHRDRIAHVQVGNVPGRHEPDHGEIDHGFLFTEMTRAGYDGWIAGEYVPAGATSDGLAWLDRWSLR